MNQETNLAIRHAISSEQFETAHRLWDEYAGMVRLSILSGSANEDMLAEMQDLVTWSRTVVLSFRAHSADRLNQSHVANIYGHSGA